MKPPKQSTALKVSAFIVAAPRYVGAIGMSVGINALEVWPFLETVELASGFALALLEGFAIAYLFGCYRLLDPRSTQAKILLGLSGSLLILLPVIALPYLIGQQNEQDASNLFAGNLLIQSLWSFAVLLVPPMIVAGVGVAEIDEVDRIAHEETSKGAIKTLRAKPPKTELPSAVDGAYVCPHGCGYSAEKKKALSGHMGRCKLKPVNSNGRVKA